MRIQAATLGPVIGANAGTSTPHDAAATRTDQAIDSLVAGGRVPALAYAVVDADSVRFESVRGTADLETGLPADRDTVFLLNSSTKALTAIAVLQLAEAGALELDDPVLTYVEHPYSPELTLRQLLSHSGGLPNPVPADWLHPLDEHADFDADARLEQRLAEYATPDFAPGTRYQYSNLGYWLLGEVIEAASGRSFTAQVQTAIAAPLGLAPETLSDQPTGPLAGGYAGAWSPTAWVLRWMSDPTMWGARRGRWWPLAPVTHDGTAYGGLFASLDTTIQVMQGLLRDEGGLLTPATRAVMLTEQKAADGAGLGVGLGWSLGSLSGVSRAGKPGGGPGAFSNLRIYPDQGLATILLANRMSVSERDIDALSDRLDAPFLASGGGR